MLDNFHRFRTRHSGPLPLTEAVFWWCHHYKTRYPAAPAPCAGQSEEGALARWGRSCWNEPPDLKRRKQTEGHPDQRRKERRKDRKKKRMVGWKEGSEETNSLFWGTHNNQLFCFLKNDTNELNSHSLNVCECVRMFLCLCGQIFAQYHHYEDTLADPHTFKWPFDS